MPASSSASQEDSSRSRSWGSIASASRGEIAKKAGSKSAASARKPPSLRVGGAGVLGVGVVEALQVPAAVGGELGDAVAALGDQAPEVPGEATPPG